jgi:hypothetical protein
MVIPVAREECVVLQQEEHALEVQSIDTHLSKGFSSTSGMTHVQDTLSVLRT